MRTFVVRFYDQNEKNETIDMVSVSADSKRDIELSIDEYFKTRDYLAMEVFEVKAVMAPQDVLAYLEIQEYQMTCKMCGGKGTVTCASAEKDSKLVTKTCFLCGGRGVK